MGIIQAFYPIFFHHKIFLNGKQIFLNKNSIEKIKIFLNEFHPKESNEFYIDNFKDLFNMRIIRQIFGDLIPNDAILLYNGEEINKDIEEQLSIYELINDIEKINYFSQKLYLKKQVKICSFLFNNYKVLEKNEKFSIIEYPQKKGKDYEN